MIIFSFEGTLANCDHRRHFVDSSKLGTKHEYLEWIKSFVESKTCPKWRPDWKSFYEACDKDKPITPVIDIFNRFWESDIEIEIWSGRCESVKNKTLEWLSENIPISYFSRKEWFLANLKMRPIGDNTPDHILKEMWLLDTLILTDKKINFVFDSHKESIDMWKRRGIFVFNCNQTDEEF